MKRKEIRFLGNSRKDLRSFPDIPRQRMGVQLYGLELGEDPNNWKPVTGVGSGVREIRIKFDDNIYRTVYVANRGNFIYILHAFQKKRQTISKADFRVIKLNYKKIPKD